MNLVYFRRDIQNEDRAQKIIRQTAAKNITKQVTVWHINLLKFKLTK